MVIRLVEANTGELSAQCSIKGGYYYYLSPPENETSGLRQPGAGRVLSARPWCSSTEPKQFQSIGIRQDHSVTTVDQNGNRTTP